MKKLLTFTCVMALSSTALDASAAIVLDRTRAIYPGGAKSISLNIKNENQKLPYLAQAWIEDTRGQKITSPFVVLPPVQRVDANQKSIVRIASVPDVEKLPKDRESIYYFNLREIPPKSDKSNVLQIAVQSKIKLFYRPEAIVPERNAVWQDQVVITKQGSGLKVENPTPYYITYVSLAHPEGKGKRPIKSFSAFMVEPKSTLDVQSPEPLGSRFIISYVNDYGGYMDVTYQCAASVCRAMKSE
ncbi:molecular chaperone [Aeromonas schubertii]|uniref:Molecular chaperone n=2 Tax=Aeromonas TaxID=642 RepID=A0A0S2SI46_9GAMM|nr:molecular chaperone [Aeromonas schubertii]ALP41373.1 molecular chaperone [Aeromonas schubertii]KUE80922.1 molecular chaperone [Aeromonas schubertii]MBZ6064623.1 molecular chaperone [Aeromonas schubertii]MBZ6073213.1 molecular chaperone [Aeromonas schubertii]QCG46811.1 molecular chaperone [Aeromonas schubertii]